jgi:cobalt/nickel transport system permease protein
MRRGRFFLAFAAVALLLAGGVSTFASSSPDGLERVAREQGIATAERPHALGDGPMADYDVAAVAGDTLSGGLAGAAGVLVVLALTTGVAFAVRRRNAAARGG